MTTQTRLDKILEIARNNALVAVDQNDLDGYHDNMLESIADECPGYTDKEFFAAELEFARLTKNS